ncbi:MAG: hypothetical protein IJ802_03615, partial [Kiritimatiellae bacterium]|nr:hypothetical protein [Kiritimatiellia bacterium]
FEEMSPAEQQAHIEKRTARRAAKVAAEGGYVEKENDGRLLYVLNAQGTAGEEPMASAVAEMEGLLHLKGKIEKCQDAASPWEIAEKWLVEKRAGMVIVVAEKDDWPSLLVAPESRWCAINVAALARDKPARETLEARVQKEIWRAAGYCMGAANSMFQPCLMRTILYPGELDLVRETVTSPEPFNKMIAGARKFGMKPVEKTTYRKACIEGWAPAPTNDVQRAIWEEVNSAKEQGPANRRGIKK